MAILKTVQLHPSTAVAPLANAYLMIGAAQLNRLTGGIQLHLACFASSAERETYKTAMAAIETNRAAYEAGDQAPSIAMPANADAGQIADVTAQRQAATAAFLAAKTALETAQATLAGIKTVEPVGLALTAQIPPSVAAACMTSGAIDIAKCYAWLMANGYPGVSSET